jgi:hypothetical protein
LPHAGYKSELIRGPGQGPWTRIEDVELATLGWVHWFNTTRLHEHLDYVPPAEFEARMPPRMPTGSWSESYKPSFHQTQDGFKDPTDFRERIGTVLNSSERAAR